MLGGFLGAGKTTTIARIAQHHINQGRRVGLVTNDQAYDLVDSHFLRSQGFHVGEVPGACFCCKFDDLIETVNQLSREEVPDIIIAEPVGSCTDLVSTVIEPMHQLHAGEFEISPFAVLLKPEHGQKILRDGQGAGFSTKAAYIFLKQLEEAHIVAINKIDKLTSEQVEELVGLIEGRFPGKQILTLSARDGTGMDKLIEAIDGPTDSVHTPLAVDYDIYAEGEAELGWLNCTATFSTTGDEFEVDRLLMDLIEQMARQLRSVQAETAHLKILAQTGEDYAIANFVGSECESELSRGSGATTDTANLIINARVAIDPETLEQIVRDAIARVAGKHNLEYEISKLQRFRPARPEPTHRMGTPE